MCSQQKRFLEKQWVFLKWSHVAGSIDLMICPYFSAKSQTLRFSKFLSWFWLHPMLRSCTDLCFSMRWMNGWLQQRSPHREPFILILGTEKFDWWVSLGKNSMASLACTFWKSPFLQNLRTVSWSNTLDFWRRTEEMPANSWNRPPTRATKVTQEKGNEMY